MNGRIGMSILALTIVGGLALGCQAGLPAAPTPDAATPQRTPSPAYPAPEPTPTRPPDTPGAAVPAEAEKAVQLARADLARRLGLKAEAIAVASVEAVHWPSTALGCPQPGMMYAQVITPGYRVVLVAGGQRYEYHTDKGTNAVLCEKEASAVPPTIAVTDPRAARAVEAARADLARRLNVDPATIAVVRVYADEFPAQDLGCWPPGSKGPEPVQPAFVTGLGIVLAAGEGRYVYHAHGGMVVFCGPW